MTVHLNLSNLNPLKDEERAKIHYMPCLIRGHGEAKVSSYFEPIITKGKHEVLKASFRGFPLLGREQRVPQGYCGVILEKTNNEMSDTCDRNLYGTHLFDKFTYWNWDSEPSDNDRVVTAMDWLDVAEALYVKQEQKKDWLHQQWTSTAPDNKVLTWICIWTIVPAGLLR
ncbi:hypothetical protein RUM44_007197 [Polyplax serrata]|uniref:Uncharacterized protein n=1 Tax=Polyplax serrata TaxID=468196 RepID=A0ABR1B007_POLSC